MHIAEGFLPALHAAAWTVAAVPFAVHGARALRREAAQSVNRRMLLAASAAFLFTLTALKLPSVAGSSSHPTGIALAGVCFGAPVTTVLALVVLVFQALLLAHGGFTTLGANLMSLGVAGAWTFCGARALLKRCGASNDVEIGVATFVASVATYATTAGQLALAFPDTQGGVAAAFTRFAAIFAVTQAPVALAESVFAVLVVRALKLNATELSDAL